MAEKKTRLDVAVFERGLTDSRAKAGALIMAGQVFVNGQKALKSGQNVKEEDQIEVRGEKMPFVSRGGYKLDKAVKAFDLSLQDKICMDIGASTGGFTDCMLQNGAKKVYAVDVGHGQLAEKLTSDVRIVNIEGVNVKALTDKIIEEAPDFVCADLSFISCKYAAEAAHRLLKNGGKAVILIKPQFEAGRAAISKGGIVKDIKAHISVLSTITDEINSLGFSVLGLTDSPIRGGDGNVEYLIYIEKTEVAVKKAFDYAAIAAQGFNK